MATRSLGVLLITALVAACASGGQHSSSASPSPSPSSSSSASGRETFSVKQLSSTAAANVYDALNTLEPEILNGRGRGAPDVYVDTVKQPDGLDRLKQISISNVSSVAYLRYDKAQSLPNEHSSGGAIVVTLR